MNPRLPKYAKELLQLLEQTPGVDLTSLTPEKIEPLREAFVSAGVAGLTDGRSLNVTEWRASARDGSLLDMTTMQKSSGNPVAALFHIHSGGMIAGDRFIGMDMVADWVERHNLIATTVEYRLAPEHPDPIPVTDCYDALVAFASQIDDSLPIIIVGMSAGGGLAAGVTLMSRDLGGPKVSAQLLMCPMLDSTNSSPSSKQFSGLGLWDRESNDTGWEALLGDRRGTSEVTHYASPTRAEDLSGLPPAFVDCGTLEVFRSEILDYAERLAQADVPVELHMWSGAFHGFDLSYPGAEVSSLALQARERWLERVLKGNME